MGPGENMGLRERTAHYGLGCGKHPVTLYAQVGRLMVALASLLTCGQASLNLHPTFLLNQLRAMCVQVTTLIDCYVYVYMQVCPRRSQVCQIFSGS